MTTNKLTSAQLAYTVAEPGTRTRRARLARDLRAVHYAARRADRMDVTYRRARYRSDPYPAAY